MWLKRPNALTDGILFATAVGLTLSVIVIVKGASNGNQYFAPLCQEVVVDVEKNGNVLAECPPGTYIEIDDASNVICRCGKQPAPLRQPSLMFNDPMPTQPSNPNPEPPRPRDDKSIEL